MYLDYYNLTEKPFNVTSDPNFLYMSKKHQEAISHMQYGIKSRLGFLELTGEIGAGKTTLCKALINSVDGNTKTAFILNPNLSDSQLLQAIVEDFGIKPKNKTRITLINELNKFLLEQLKYDNNAVLIIDESQNLRKSTLEQIRLLSNMETEKQKLLQIILVGQPELKEKLASDKLRQLRQRIAVRYHINPLDEKETKEYIYHRIKIAGGENSITFDDNAIKEIFKSSGGVPRLINILNDKILLAGYAYGTKNITIDIVKKCANELEGRF